MEPIVVPSGLYLNEPIKTVFLRVFSLFFEKISKNAVVIPLKRKTP